MPKEQKQLFIDDFRDLKLWKNAQGFYQLQEGEWEQAWTFDEARRKLNEWKDDPNVVIAAISFDNDINDAQFTGYDILKVVEEWIHTELIPLPKLYVHTANPVAEKKMWLVINRLEELFGCDES